MAAKKTQLALVLVLIAVALWRWSGIVRTPTVLPDEQVYLRAAQHLGLGESPYDEPGYFYPPPIATFVLAASARLGEIGALQLLRALSLAGLTLAVWLSLLAISCPWWMRLAAGAAYITLAPAVEIATALGNAAGIAAGLVLVGLFSWRRRPLLAGVALGIGLAFKPVAPLAPLLLALHRPTDSTRNHLIAA
ncbi:MAG: glycosyltransferase 87 family protein, partial [Acidobacteriota bacterium]|nr:glycosyltransferase 87 family protein [Acidobacteriota bacterium]